MTRPQEPRAPWPYTVQEIRFPASTRSITLAGALSVPDDRAPLAAALLLSGSGAQDRDESIAGHRPFLVLGDHLTRRGFAVLRWDDRGVGESGGDYLSSSPGELVGDAIQALDWLEERFPDCPLALIGHSQGTIVAGRVASRRPESVAAIVLLAGAGRPGREVLLDQHRRIARAEGVDDETIAASIEVKRRVFDLLFEADERLALSVEHEPILAELRGRLVDLFTSGEGLAGLTGDERRDLDEVVDDLLEWEWRFLLTADPASDLARARAPVLALTGERDSQVCAVEDLAGIEAALRAGGNECVRTESLADLNHLFQTCETGGTSEYATIEETWAPAALQTTSDWLKARLRPSA